MNFTSTVPVRPDSCFAIRAGYLDGVAVFRWVLDFWFTVMEGTRESLNRGAGGGLRSESTQMFTTGGECP